MKVLVTGADGLLGTNLVRELIENNFSIRVLLQPNSQSPTLKDLKLERLTADLLGEEKVIIEAMEGCDAVFHCAAITDLWADPKLVFKVNLEGTRKILDACLKAKVKRLVYVGSASSFQFGSLAKPGDERGNFPNEYRGVAYMESKYQAMNLVRDYVFGKKLDAIIVAPTFMLGAYDFRPSSGELIRVFIKRGLRYVSKGGRNFVYVRDVARAMVSALELGRRGEAYILGGENLSYLHFFTKVARIANVRFPKFSLPNSLILSGGLFGSVYEMLSGKRGVFNLRMARFSCLCTYYSSDKAIKELKMPRTPIERAIEESIQSLKQYGHI